MADEDKNLNFHFENYPPSAGEGIIRTVGFGISNDVKLLLEISEAEDGANIALTLSGVENEDTPEFMDTVVELLSLVKEKLIAQIKIELDKEKDNG